MNASPSGCDERIDSPHPQSWRHKHKTIIHAMLLSFAAILLYTTGTFSLSATPALTGADKILAENALIDGHNDLLILIRALYGNKIYEKNFTQPFQYGNMSGQFDLPRAVKGRMGGTFWSAWVCIPHCEGVELISKPFLISPNL